jgi:hypothetical protein
MDERKKMMAMKEAQSFMAISSGRRLWQRQKRAKNFIEALSNI